MTNIVVLTGAGISAESGIPTFRDSAGLWEEHDVMKVASPKGFKDDPALVHRFYNDRRAALKSVEPNAAHKALVELEQAWDKIGGFLLVTQNVDDLHERAGSKNVAHMHGELRRIRCVSCSHDEETDGETTVDTQCPKCSLPMRPDVVWFGEYPYHTDMIEIALDHTDILVVIGTSGEVMPASLFPAAVFCANPDARIIEINPNPTPNELIQEVIVKTATQGVPALVQELIHAHSK